MVVVSRLSSLLVIATIALSGYPVLGTTATAQPSYNIGFSKTLGSAEEPVLIAQQSRTQRIRFKPGADSAIINTSVIRGTRDIYLLGAQKGQTMTVKIESLENNALFDIEAPPTKSGQRRVLREGVTAWSGKLPDSGDYQITIGSTRGNASYRLTVMIR